jgi:hypothetical protein
LLRKKKAFTREPGAWTQYEQLADWLIEIASIVNIRGTKMEDEFCEIVEYSFGSSSKQQYLGYSWYAWNTWNNRWGEMKIENQFMIKEIIENGNWRPRSEIPDILKGNF